MKTSIGLMQITLILMAVIGVFSCQKKADDGIGKAEFSLNLPGETGKLKSGSMLDSAIVSYRLMISVEDMLGNSVFTDKLISLYAFGTSFVSEKVEIKTGEYKLTKFMVINQFDTVIYAAPLAGSTLAYLTSRPLPINFNIYPGQVTTVLPEVLAVVNHSPEQFGYVSFGATIIKPLDFYTICVLDNPLLMAPTQVTTARLTITASDGWHYTFMLQAAENHLIIRGGSKKYDFLIEKEGYLPQKLQFTEADLKATSNENPLVLIIQWGSTTLPFEAAYSFSTPVIDGQINASEWSGANVYPIVFTRYDSVDTRPGTLYLQHDSTWLYIGVKTNTSAGWDVYLSIFIDGNFDHLLSGNSTEPHTDINIEYPSPGGWSGYIRYDYLVSTNVYPTTQPAGTASASYGSSTVSYEYKIKLSDLNTSTGQIIGFHMFNLNDAIVAHGYEYPMISAMLNPSKWGQIKIK